MRKSTLILTIALAPAAIAQQVIAGGGGNHTNSTGRITYTIGEPVFTTASTGGHTLTQGFQQPWADISTLVEEEVEPIIGINVYPNPVRHVLYIDVPDGANADRFVLYDATGRQVTDGRIIGTGTQLDMQPYASGGYILRVIGANDTHQQAFKITLTH